MQLNYWLYDCFSNKSFHGHTCAIVEVNEFLDKDLVSKICRELCQKVTSFFYRNGSGVFLQSFSVDKSLWPINHSLIAVAKHCFYENESGTLYSGSYPINVCIKNNSVEINLRKEQTILNSVPDRLNQALDIYPVSVREVGKTCIVETRTIDDLINLTPDFNRISKMDHYERVVITAEDPSGVHDYVCRYFSPKHGINENDASLYIQTFMPFFWAERLQKNSMSFMQLSNRKGEGKVEVVGDNVIVSANAVATFAGQLKIS